MDLTPVLTALAGAAGGAASQAVSQALRKAVEIEFVPRYEALKTLLARRFGPGNDLVTGMELLEVDPTSTAGMQLLTEGMEVTNADQDPEIVAAAAAAQDSLDRAQSQAQGAMYNQNIYGGQNAVTWGSGDAIQYNTSVPREWLSVWAHEIHDMAGIGRVGPLVQLAAVPGIDEELDGAP